MERFVQMAASVADAAGNHPVTAVAGGVFMQIIAALQSSQQVATTLMALITSLAGVLSALLGLWGVWKRRNKE